jgi:5'-deoxynucleotidase YfbR-like HD superfamily hydrolase
MADYITTYTGLHFEPLNPDPAKFRIEDIAHALSLTCRGNGHVKTFFSVAQHCVFCAREAQARGMSPKVALACLLHDACECYLSDVPTPFKKNLPSYIKAEEEMLELVYTRFLGAPLTAEEEAQVNVIDKDMLYYDLKELLGTVEDRPAPVLMSRISYAVRSFEEVERDYLDCYREISAALA